MIAPYIAELTFIDERAPIVLFGIIALIARCVPVVSLSVFFMYTM